MRFMILAGFFVAGCGAATGPAERGASTNSPDTCNAAAHQGLIGLDAASSLALPEPKRVYGPTDAVTTDYNPARLNVQLDAVDNIVAITCG